MHAGFNISLPRRLCFRRPAKYSAWQVGPAAGGCSHRTVHLTSRQPHFWEFRFNHLTSMRQLSATAFEGSTCAQLEAWLESNNICCSDFGKGCAKSTIDLLAEIKKGECLLELQDNTAIRRLEVLNVFIWSNDKKRILIEDYQVRPGGAVRRRCLPLSEKLLPGENWREALLRAVSEELGTALGNDSSAVPEILPGTYKSRVDAAVPRYKSGSQHPTQG